MRDSPWSKRACPIRAISLIKRDLVSYPATPSIPPTPNQSPGNSQLACASLPCVSHVVPACNLMYPIRIFFKMQSHRLVRFVGASIRVTRCHSPEAVNSDPVKSRLNIPRLARMPSNTGPAAFAPSSPSRSQICANPRPPPPIPRTLVSLRAATLSPTLVSVELLHREHLASSYKGARVPHSLLI